MAFELPVDNDTLIHERILAITGDDLNTIPADAPVETASETQSEAAPAEATPHTAPAVEQSSDPEIPVPEEAGTEPPLTPPASWNADEKADFLASTRAQQQAALRLEEGRRARHSRAENEIAERLKGLETETAAARQARETMTRQLDEILPALGQQLQGKWANTDWVKLAKDAPADYVAFKAEYDRDVQIWQTAQAKKSELDLQQQRENERLDSVRREEQEKILIERIPEWADTDRGKKEFREVQQHLIERGIPASLVRDLSDAVQIEIARDAMLHRRAKAALKKPAAAATAVTPPKVMKPGSARTEAPVNQAAEADRRRFEESPTPQNAAAMIKRMLK